MVPTSCGAKSTVTGHYIPNEQRNRNIKIQCPQLCARKISSVLGENCWRNKPLAHPKLQSRRIRDAMFSFSSMKLNSHATASGSDAQENAKGLENTEADTYGAPLPPPDVTAALDEGPVSLEEAMQWEGAVFSNDGIAQTFNNDNESIAAAINSLAVFDMSHFGRIRVSGDDRIRFLHNQTTANFQALKESEGCDTVFVTPTARTIDLATAWIMSSSVILTVSPSKRKQLAAMLNKYIFFADKVEVQDITEKTCQLAVIGPKSSEVLQRLGLGDLVGKPYGSHKHFSFQGSPVTVAVGSGLGLDGFQLLLSPEAAGPVWSALVENGGLPLGATAWEVLRVQQGRPWPEKELTDEFNPLEAGLWHTISTAKGCYIGQETIARLITYDGVSKHLYGVQLAAPVSVGSTIFATDGTTKLGKVTSYALASGQHLALGYIRKKGGGAGQEVLVDGVAGTLVDPTFLSRSLPASDPQSAPTGKSGSQPQRRLSLGLMLLLASSMAAPLLPDQAMAASPVYLNGEAAQEHRQREAMGAVNPQFGPLQSSPLIAQSEPPSMGVRSGGLLPQLAAGGSLWNSKAAERASSTATTLSSHSALVDEAWQVVNDVFLDARHKGWTQEQWQLQRERALSRPPRSRMAAYSSISTMLASLNDPYTRFLQPSQFAELAKYDVTGVGLNIGEEGAEGAEGGGPPKLKVLGIVLGSPAQLSGMQQGDELVSVDGVGVEGKSAFDVSSLIQGPKDTPVKVQFRRGASDPPSEVELIRVMDVLSPVYYRLDRSSGRGGGFWKADGEEGGEAVGYIKLKEFNALAKRDLVTAIERLQKAGATSFTLDLQDNPGGLVQAGIEIARLFLPQGSTVIYTEGRNALISKSVIANENGISSAPLTVMVNNRTASASEIVAAALHDNCRAVLVGGRTFGKGLIQSVYELSDGSGIVVTVGKYVTPAHNDIDGNGIEPDFGRWPGSTKAVEKLEACQPPQLL